ncbi:MAG: hypothetical protein JWN25_1725 [Verrucomicrobiales bacterium]|nr:hypothetical protein [Verrucomicrobiales bacterium]
MEQNPNYKITCQLFPNIEAVISDDEAGPHVGMITNPPRNSFVSAYGSSWTSFFPSLTETIVAVCGGCILRQLR